MAWVAAGAVGRALAAAPAATGGGNPATEAIGFYQAYISSLRHARCPFDPSCSQYALESIRARGVIAGSALAADRLMRCNTSARRFYARGDDGRFDDPVGREGRSRRMPRLPAWLVSPPLDSSGPVGAGSDTSSAPLLASIDFARTLAAAGDCERATSEYLRVAHAMGTPEWSAWARLGAGSCFYRAEQWATAETEFLQAGMLDAAARPQIWRLAAACRFNAGDFVACESLLVRADEAPLVVDDSDRAVASAPTLADPTAGSIAMPTGDRVRTLIFRGVCDMAHGNWDLAGEHFAAAEEMSAGAMYPAKLRLLSTFAVDGENLPHKSPGLATGFSAVIPGAGQMYTGRVQDGIRHLLFNGVLVYSVVALVNGENYPAAVLVAGIELPFYLGNIRGAGWAARAFNRSHRMDFVTAALAATEE